MSFDPATEVEFTTALGVKKRTHAIGPLGAHVEEGWAMIVHRASGELVYAADDGEEGVPRTMFIADCLAPEFAVIEAAAKTLSDGIYDDLAQTRCVPALQDFTLNTIKPWLEAVCHHEDFRQPLRHWARENNVELPTQLLQRLK